MSTVLSVRDATANDIDSIIQGIQEFVSHSSYGDSAAVDPAHVARMLRALIDSPDGIVAVLETQQGFCGAFVGLAHAHLFSGQRQLGELFLYTVPSMRGHGPKLRRYAEAWARETGCTGMVLAHPDGVNDLALEKVYRRWGYRPIERNYAKDLH